MSGDRNAPSKEQLQQQFARRQFAQAVAAGQTGIIDRFGAILQAGDAVLYWPSPYGLIWQVKECGPNLDPNVPAGIMKVVLVCEVPLNLQAGKPLLDLLRVIKATGQPAAAMGGSPADGEQAAELTPEEIAAAEAGPAAPDGETRGPEPSE